MTVTPLIDASGAGRLDAPMRSPMPPARPILGAASADAGTNFSRAVTSAFDAASDALARADTAESAFVQGRGGLQEMVLERAQADVALSIASATTTHVAQSLQTILGMQV